MSSFTINRVVLIGRLTKDPELRALPSGAGVCNLRVACNSTRRDPEGEYHDKPNYFDVSVYGVTAESVSRYTRKGSRVAIDGRLDWREWETSDRQKRQTVSVVADTVMFLDNSGGRSEDGPSRDGESGYYDLDTDRGPAGERDRGSGGGFDREPDGELAGVGAGATDDDLVF